MQNEKMGAIHDGQRVRHVLSQTHFSHKEFNRLMGWKPRRIEAMLKKEHWTTGELVRAGEILGYNFFDEYCLDSVHKLLKTISVPVNVLTDPLALEQLRNEILSLADHIRQDKGD